MKFGEKDVKIVENPEGVKHEIDCLTLSGLLKILYFVAPEFHSGLFMLNPLGIFRFSKLVTQSVMVQYALMGNGQSFELAPSFI